MRPNNSSKRTRGRSRSKNTNPLARSYESNGPDVKIRGSALQVADKYAQLARDAQSSGDRVMAENYFQHAEHYYRIVAQAYEQNNQNQQQPRERRDEDRPNRQDDRPAYRGGEQPTINGFDGIEEDDDGVRRTMRVNGHAPNGAARSDEADAAEPAVQANGEQDTQSTPDEAEVVNIEVAPVEEAPPAPAPRRTRSRSARSAPPPAETNGAGHAEASADAETGESDAPPAPKPRRRTRATTTKRTRSRASAGAAAADSPPEASEPSN